MNPLGVNGSKTTKPWADAIKRALARRAEGKLADINVLADVLLDKVLEGDMQALKEFGDRMDGKPAQTIAGDPDAPHSMVIGWAIPQSK